MASRRFMSGSLARWLASLKTMRVLLVRYTTDWRQKLVTYLWPRMRATARKNDALRTLWAVAAFRRRGWSLQDLGDECVHTRRLGMALSSLPAACADNPAERMAAWMDSWRCSASRWRYLTASSALRRWMQTAARSRRWSTLSASGPRSTTDEMSGVGRGQHSHDARAASRAHRPSPQRQAERGLLRVWLARTGPRSTCFRSSEYDRENGNLGKSSKRFVSRPRRKMAVSSEGS